MHLVREWISLDAQGFCPEEGWHSSGVGGWGSRSLKEVGSQGRCDAGRAVGSRVTSQERGQPQGFMLPPQDRPWVSFDVPVTALTWAAGRLLCGSQEPLPQT